MTETPMQVARTCYDNVQRAGWKVSWVVNVTLRTEGGGDARPPRGISKFLDFAGTAKTLWKCFSVFWKETCKSIFINKVHEP